MLLVRPYGLRRPRSKWCTAVDPHEPMNAPGSFVQLVLAARDLDVPGCQDCALRVRHECAMPNYLAPHDPEDCHPTRDRGFLGVVCGCDRMLIPFPIPDDFRGFMRTVAEHLDRPNEDKFLDTEDAFQHECGHGGRTFGGTANYNFTYMTTDGQYRWELSLREQQIRDIADGNVTEVDGIRDDIVRTTRRQSRGHALLVWGEYREDAFRVRAPHELLDALDTLHAAAAEDARMIRLWSAADDQLVAVMWRDDCAIYVVEAVDGYGSSEGDLTRDGAFETLDHDGHAMAVAWADCVEWALARRALIRFSEHGDIGTEIKLSGSIPSGLLMLGDFDRASVIAARGEPPSDLNRSSLPRMVPTTHHDPNVGWSDRLIDALHHLELVKIEDGRVRESVIEHLSGLLHTHGDEAVEDGQTADWLTNEISMIRGVDRLIATGGDLQIALRRSR